MGMKAHPLPSSPPLLPSYGHHCPLVERNSHWRDRGGYGYAVRPPRSKCRVVVGREALPRWKCKRERWWLATTTPCFEWGRVVHGRKVLCLVFRARGMRWQRSPCSLEMWGRGGQKHPPSHISSKGDGGWWKSPRSLKMRDRWVVARRGDHVKWCWRACVPSFVPIYILVTKDIENSGHTFEALIAFPPPAIFVHVVVRQGRSLSHISNSCFSVLPCCSVCVH